MKTIEPNMKLDRQVRKANLVNEMVQSACNGQPRPWSEFSPMIDEEFS